MTLVNASHIVLEGTEEYITTGVEYYSTGHYLETYWLNENTLHDLLQMVVIRAIDLLL